jgi:hypothetical protein
MNRNVIDPVNATPEQQEYVSMIDRFKAQYKETDEDKLKEAFFNTYKYTRGWMSCMMRKPGRGLRIGLRVWEYQEVVQE